MRSFLLIISALTVLTACDDPTSGSQADVYQDTKNFIDSQVVILNREKPMVQKTVWLNNRDQTQQTDSIDWNRELELFRQADINKPAFRTSYATARPDSLTYQYTIRPGEKPLTVRSLTIRLDAVSHQPAQVSVVLQSQNPLFKSERQLLLDCAMTPARHWRVTHYRVEGFRELTFFGRTEFRIEGRVSH